MPRFHCLILLLLTVLAGSSQARADERDVEDGSLHKILHPDRSEKNLYQGKMFNSGSAYSAKSFTTKEYSGNKAFESKSFASKPFAEAKQGWLGDKLFPKKKLPENLQASNRDATKQFATKNALVKDYADLSKKNGLSSHEAYATHDFSQKIQATSNNAQLQEELSRGVKKGLTEEEVRDLLNKPIQGKAE